LNAARELGCRTLNGERMVVLQAADAFHHYTGIERMLRRFKPGGG
jgi:shikimate 5-dehydrogenase